MVEVKKLGLFTISAVRARPSAEIRVVEVKKLRTFYDFCGARATEIRVVEVNKLRTFYDFCGARATLCGDSRGRGSKTEDFLRFLRCARDRLRRFAWSSFKNWGLFTISAVRARPSAEIRVVEAQKLTTFYDFCGPRATVCGDRARRSAPVRICLSLGEPVAEIVRVEALSLWRRAFFLLAKRPLEVVSWFARLLSQSRGRGFDSPLVRGSSGLKIAAFEYKRGTRSALLQPRLENRNFSWRPN